MQISVGIDIAKEIHWATAIDADGTVRIDRKLLNTPSDIAALADELTALHAKVRIGLDVIGGIAGPPSVPMTVRHRSSGSLAL